MAINKQGIVRATAIIVAGNLLSSMLGFARETVVASHFGATARTDAYLIAFIVPGAVIALVASSIPVAFIPVFTEYRVKYGEEEGWRMTSTLINLVLIILILVAMANFLAASIYIPLLSPGLSPWARALAIYLTKLMSPVIILIGLAGLSTSVLNAYRHFTYPALASSLYNIGIIASIVFLSSSLGITGLPVGMILGALAQLIIQSLPLKNMKKNYAASFHYLRHPGVKKIAVLILPLTIGSAATNINLVINRVLASGLAEGSISALNFATLVTQLPITIFAAAITTAVYPTLSQHVAEENFEKVLQTFSEGLRMLWLIIVPISIAFIAFSQPIIQLLFERGAFGVEATRMTSVALTYLSLSLFALAGTAILFRVYSSMQDTLTPVVIAVVAIIVNIILSLVLVRVLALGGIALANSIAAFINFALLAYKMRQKLGSLDGRRIFVSTAKTSIASVVTVAACWLGFSWLGPQKTPIFSHQLFRFGGIAIVGLLLYAALATALGMEEIVRIKNIAAMKLKLYRKVESQL